VQSGISLLTLTPALLIMISTWNLPVLGWEKAFLAEVIRCAGPVGVPTSACTTRVRIPCSLERDSESAVQEASEDGEV